MLLLYVDWWKSKGQQSRTNALTPLSTPALDRAAQTLFAEPDKDSASGERELLIPDRGTGRVSKVKLRPTKASTFATHHRHFTQLVATDRVGV